MMRIALVSQEYPPETASGGIGSQTQIKARGLASLGHEVWVITHSVDEEFHRRREDGVQVLRIPGPDRRLAVNTDAVRWLTYSAEVAAALSELHGRVSLDIVEFAEWGAEGYVHLLNRTDWEQLPAVVQLHGPLVMFAHAMGWPDPDSEFYRVGTHMEGTCLRLADRVYSSSRCSAQWVADHYGLSFDDIPVMHTGVDTQLFTPLDVPKSSDPTVIFVGKIAENKGVEILVDAACRLAGHIPNLKLRLVGRGEPALLRRLRSRAREAGHPGLLEFPGFVGREELPRMLSGAHVFAAPSRYEGGPGFVYLEAMACGLPAIAAGGSGASEVVSHGDNGLLVPPDDPEALTEALRELLEDAALRESMGRRGRAYVEAEGDSAACLKRIEEFYRHVINNSLHEQPRPGVLAVPNQRI